MAIADSFEALGAALLAQARDAIAAQFGVGTSSSAAMDAAAAVSLEDPGATFVTLTLRGQLRGCIGTLSAHRTLAVDVRSNAVAAAFRDPRFPPLSRAEFSSTRIEVSLLATPVPMQVGDESDALAQLRPARDGIVLSWRGRSATFLPQVWETLPDRAEFLRTLKRKAGLPADFWAPDLRLERYSVRKWVESGEQHRELQR